MDSLNGVIEQLHVRVVECDLLQQTWQQHVSTINASCNITTAAPGAKAKPPPVSPVTAPAISLTPASMSAMAGGESAVDAMAKTPAIAATLVAKLKDSWQHLLRDRAARGMYTSL